MTSTRAGRIVYMIAFVVLLADGAGAIWLGQLTGHTSLVVAGLVLLAAALGLTVVYRRWRSALAEILAIRRDLRSEVELLRRVVEGSRAGPWNQN